MEMIVASRMVSKISELVVKAILIPPPIMKQEFVE
jgi:hypothetical protein